MEKWRIGLSGEEIRRPPLTFAYLLYLFTSPFIRLSIPSFPLSIYLSCCIRHSNSQIVLARFLWAVKLDQSRTGSRYAEPLWRTLV
jgi:hypothetical protein